MNTSIRSLSEMAKGMQNELYRPPHTVKTRHLCQRLKMKRGTVLYHLRKLFPGHSDSYSFTEDTAAAIEDYIRHRRWPRHDSKHDQS